MTNRPPTGAAPPGTRSLGARVALLAAALVALLWGLAIAGPAASAQDDGPSGLQVTAVDATGDLIEVAVLPGPESVDRADVAVREGGEDRPAEVTTARQRQAATEIVFVVDTATRSVGKGVLAGLAEALDQELGGLPDSVRVGLIRAGSEAEVLARPTTDRQRPLQELAGLGADEGSALYDGIGRAAATFGDQPGVVRTVVVVTAGTDTASTTTVEAAELLLLQRGAQLLAVSVGQTDPGLQRLVQRVGGTVLTAAVGDEAARSPAEAVAAATAMAADRIVVSYPRSAEFGERPDVELTLGQEQVRFSYPVGSVTLNRLQLAPTVEPAPEEPSILGHPLVFYLSVGLAFVAIAAGVWAVASIFGSGESSLDKVLARYADHDETLDEAEVHEMLVESALMRRAVAMTEDFAERQGFLTRLEEMLEGANLPVRAGEAMFILVGSVVVVFGVTALVTGSLIVAAIVAIVTAATGLIALQLAARRRLRAFEAQLPDALQLLAGTLRAGHSLPQGLDAVSTEIADPMGYELRRAITEAQLGRDLEDALANVGERLDSPDFAWAVMAIGIQREVGGNLAEVLLSVAETMIQRDRLRREVNALTAEGRVSAAILSLMPPGLGVVMWVMNPSYVEVLFSRTLGLILLGLAVVSGLIGLFWMRKVITIDA